MKRRRKWDNPRMWEHAAELRAGGLTYSEIAGQLSKTENIKRFSLQIAPQEDTARRELHRRRTATDQIQLGTHQKFVEALQEAIWVPAPYALRVDPFLDRTNPRILDLDGRKLTWYAEGREIVRCWLTEKEEAYLQRLLSGNHELLEAYKNLQDLAKAYLSAAGRHLLAEFFGGGVESLDKVQQAMDAGVKFTRDAFEVKDAGVLLDTYPLLRGKVEEFLRDLRLTLV